jgi:hypothetical protein
MIMRGCFALLVFLASSVIGFCAPGVMTVTNGVFCVLPVADEFPYSAAWATNTAYVRGKYVTANGYEYLYCVRHIVQRGDGGAERVGGCG